MVQTKDINQSIFIFESGKSPYTETHTRMHKTQYTILLRIKYRVHTS